MSSSIEKADEVLANAPNRRPSVVDSLPAACRFSFEHVTSNSIAVDLIEIPTALDNRVKTFNLWSSQENEDIFSKGPICSFQRDHPKRILISSLRPCTEYTFTAVAYGDEGEVGCSEAKCLTKSVDNNHEKSNLPNPVDSGIQKQYLQGNCSSAGVDRHCGVADLSETQAVQDKQSPPATRDLDLNVAVSPLDLNEDVDPPLVEANGCTLGAVRADDNDEAHGVTNDEAKISLNEEALCSNSALVRGSPLRASGGLEENFEECVKIIRCLEHSGHIETGFRLKFLTWFSLRSTVQERRVVNSFIQAFADDGESLAAQLVDCFKDIISSKRLKL